jgi:tetratricopeptide (TPR) repeat protein
MCVAVALLALPAGPHSQSQNVAGLIDRYQSGDFGAAVHAAADNTSDLRTLLQQLNMAVPLLARARLPETAADTQRRLAIATFALEVVMARRSSLYRDSGRLLLEWACSLLRRDSTPMPAERLWHLAAIGVIEGAADGMALDTHLDHVEKRFPKEPRLALARAVAAELQTWYQSEPGSVYEPTRGLFLSRLRIAAFIPEVRDETLLRWGFFDLRQGNARSALDHLNDIGPTADTYLDYLRHLFRGRALDRSNKHEEALDAYRLAMLAAPHAQTARLALASALASGNSRTDALETLGRALSDAHDVLADPWFTYGSADQRFWPTLITELRQAVRR